MPPAFAGGDKGAKGQSQVVATHRTLNLSVFSDVPRLDRGTQYGSSPKIVMPGLDPGIWLKCGSVLPGNLKSRQIPGSRIRSPEDDEIGGLWHGLPMNGEPFESQPDPPPESGGIPPWLAATRDMLVFQGKLFLDWLRDLILAPTAVVALILGLVTRPNDPGYLFYRLMAWGRMSDRFIGLFSAGEQRTDSADSAEGIPSLDELVGHLENVIVTEHQSGALSAKAKARIETALHDLETRIEADQSGTVSGLKSVTARMRERLKDGRAN